MLSIAIWLLFLGNYFILYSSMHLNFYFENLMFYIYGITAAILNLSILCKIKKIKININSILLISFIISIVISILITYQSSPEGDLVKLSYIILCIIFMIDAYIIGINNNVFSINPKVVFLLTIFSLIIMICMMLYDVLVLNVFRLAIASNPIGTSRAIAVGFLFLFSFYFFKNRYSLSFFIYLAGLLFSFISQTRQIFISYLALVFIFSFIPYFKNTSMAFIKTLIKNILFILFSIVIFFIIFNAKRTDVRIDTKNDKYSYMNLVINRFQGGDESKFKSLNDRKKIFQEGIEIISNKPMFGKIFYEQKSSNFMHHMLLDIYASFGIFPVLIYLLINFLVIRKIRIEKIKNDFNYFFFLLLFFFFTIPSLFVTTFLIHPFYYFVLFYLLGSKNEIPQEQNIAKSIS